MTTQPIAGPLPNQLPPLFRVELEDGRRWIVNDQLHGTLREAWDYGESILRQWALTRNFRVMRADDPIPWAVYSCSGCGPFVAGQLAPSHRGSTGCESGSLASGGSHSHCSCDACF